VNHSSVLPIFFALTCANFRIASYLPSNAALAEFAVQAVFFRFIAPVFSRPAALTNTAIMMATGRT
jgi:hypothetical protein